jgi:hypothetical protein
MKPRIDLHIEELVLHGFPPGRRYQIAEALQAELTRLLTVHGVPDRMGTGSEIASVDAGSIQMSPGHRPAAIGAHVAQSVYSSLSGLQGRGR